MNNALQGKWRKDYKTKRHGVRGEIRILHDVKSHMFSPP
jgi:hypothetical protein